MVEFVPASRGGRQGVGWWGDGFRLASCSLGWGRNSLTCKHRVAMRINRHGLGNAGWPSSLYENGSSLCWFPPSADSLPLPGQSPGLMAVPKGEGKNTTEHKGNEADTHPACSPQPQPSLPYPAQPSRLQNREQQVSRGRLLPILSVPRGQVALKGPPCAPLKALSQALERAPGQVSHQQCASGGSPSKLSTEIGFFPHKRSRTQKSPITS